MFMARVFSHYGYPNQNSSLLYVITILTTLDMIFGMPLEVCWNIFGATNKVKMPAIAMFVTGGLTFLSLLVLLYIYKDPTAQLICLASARTFWNIIKNLTFLPFYGARCLNLKWNFFYHSMAKPVLGNFYCIVNMPNLSFYDCSEYLGRIYTFFHSCMLICFDYRKSVHSAKKDIKYIFQKIRK